jgi:hypothetical protein
VSVNALDYITIGIAIGAMVMRIAMSCRPYRKRKPRALPE